MLRNIAGLISLMAGACFTEGWAGALAAPPAPCTVSVVPDGPVVAGEETTLRFVVRATPDGAGLAPGNAIEIRFPLCAPLPFTRWVAPQTNDPRSPGYVRVPDGVEILVRPSTGARVCRGFPLRLTHLHPPVLVATFREGLSPGEEREIVYGDTTASSSGRGRAQKFPEEASPWRFFLHADRADSTIETELMTFELTVSRTSPAWLHVSGPANASRELPFRVRVAALDSLGFPASPFPETAVSARHESGFVRTIDARPEAAADSSARFFPVALDRSGIWWIEVRAVDSPSPVRAGWTLPVVVDSTRGPIPKLVFGDLHWHTNRSDGSRSPREGYRYARDVVGLDFTAKTDHDLQPNYNCMGDDAWLESEAFVREFEQPGVFAALLGWEWTYPAGHENVYFRGETGPYRPLQDFKKPEALWASLPPGDALTIPHHPAGGISTPPMSWNSFDPRFVKSVEIFSSHGDGEAPGAPYRPMRRSDGGLVEGSGRGTAQEALARGYRFAFLASTDDHASTPGCPVRRIRRDIPAGPGLCAAWVDSLARGPVFDAIAGGKTYATTGPRIRLEARRTKEGVEGLVVGTAELARVELVGVRDGDDIPFPAVAALPAQRRVSRWSWSPASGADSSLDAVILRVTQVDHEMAWSSPIFLRDESTGEPRP